MSDDGIPDPVRTEPVTTATSPTLIVGGDTMSWSMKGRKRCGADRSGVGRTPGDELADGLVLLDPLPHAMATLSDTLIQRICLFISFAPATLDHRGAVSVSFL